MKDNHSTIKAFITDFVQPEFFSDIINICLYPTEFGIVTTSQGNTVITHVHQFFGDLEKQCDFLKIPNTKQIKNFISITKTILNIRETGNIITYDNINQHTQGTDLVQKKLIQLACDNKINDELGFRQLINQIIDKIGAYYEVEAIKNSINMFDEFHRYAEQPGISVFEATKKFKDNVISLYNDLAKLQCTRRSEQEEDYFVIRDKNSTKPLAHTLVNFLETGYNYFKSGYELIDDTFAGFESSTVHVISAPSNHGKSIFMVNIVKKIIEENINEFKPEDAIVVITLEDDIRRLMRRFCSIFGNFTAQVLKDLYLRSSEILRSQQNHFNSIDLTVNKIEKIFQSLLNNSVVKLTNGKVSLVIKHCNENSFSPADISKFIDRLKMEGLNTKLVVADYVDVMSPSVTRKGSFSDYDAQGDIIQDLRILSRHHKIPVITATQNRRESEVLSTPLNNTMIGDSYKKIRFSDFIYMCRMRKDLDIFSPEVRRFVIPNDLYSGPDQIKPEILRMKDQITSDLIPFELKITKSKEEGRDKLRYGLFCVHNLRVYNGLSEYLIDIKPLLSNSKKLQQDIDMLSSLINSSIMEDGINSLSEVLPFAQAAF